MWDPSFYALRLSVLLDIAMKPGLVSFGAKIEEERIFEPVGK